MFQKLFKSYFLGEKVVNLTVQNYTKYVIAKDKLEP